MIEFPIVANEAGNEVPVAGTVSVNNFPASTEIANDVGNPVPTTVTNAVASPVPVNLVQTIITTPELEEITVLASALRSVTFNSPVFTNRFHRGLRLYLNVTAVTGTLQTLNIKMQTQDPVSGVWLDMANAAFPEISATGAWSLVVYPGINQSTTGSAVRVSTIMSRTWRVVSTIGGTDPSFTYSIGGLLVP